MFNAGKRLNPFFIRASFSTPVLDFLCNFNGLQRGLGGFLGVKKLTGHFSLFHALLPPFGSVENHRAVPLPSPWRLSGNGGFGMGSALGYSTLWLRKREWVRVSFSVRHVSFLGCMQVGQSAARSVVHGVLLGTLRFVQPTVLRFVERSVQAQRNRLRCCHEVTPLPDPLWLDRAYF